MSGPSGALRDAARAFYVMEEWRGFSTREDREHMVRSLAALLAEREAAAFRRGAEAMRKAVSKSMEPQPHETDTPAIQHALRLLADGIRALPILEPKG